MQLAREHIDLLRQVAPVEVVMAGNHDRHSSIALMMYLSAAYEDVDDVQSRLRPTTAATSPTATPYSASPTATVCPARPTWPALWPLKHGNSGVDQAQGVVPRPPASPAPHRRRRLPYRTDAVPRRVRPLPLARATPPLLPVLPPTSLTKMRATSVPRTSCSRGLSMGFARDGMPKKLRKCNNCGREAMRRTNGHCKRWDKELKKNVYCGSMNVVKKGTPNKWNMEDGING